MDRTPACSLVRVVTGGDRGDLPAAALGVTPLQASHLYDWPLDQVFRLYVWGVPDRLAPVGRTDRWNCWWAAPEDVARAFGGNKRRELQATAPTAVNKAEARAARRRAALGGAP
jgi:hypothetical protein